METKDIISSGLLEQYAAGLTSEKETVQVAQWVAQYPDVAAELAEITTSIEAYAQAQSIIPAPNVKEKIFARINEANNGKIIQAYSPVSTANTKGMVAPMWRVAAAASVILLVGSIALNVVTYNKYNNTDKELIAARNTLNTFEESNKLMEADMNVVQSRYSVPVALKGLEAAPEANAKIFWMQNTGEVFIDPSNLPEAPAGKRYQLWGIVDGKPVDGGMILTSKQGDRYRIQKMKTFGKAEAFAVTLEDEKGNPTPKGPMFVMGKM
ncbi:MAG: anti-sigma factor [Ferruginibacter sp.]